ncbi:MAG: hypothetical protein KAJ52_03040, partial [Sedimentisphaerales bacterium]|nr:hypothetical protein [Sedimentisphaerales bacterium]
RCRKRGTRSTRAPIVMAKIRRTQYVLGISLFCRLGGTFLYFREVFLSNPRHGKPSKVILN